jgi:hypothetical protein
MKTHDRIRRLWRRTPAVLGALAATGMTAAIVATSVAGAHGATPGKAGAARSPAAHHRHHKRKHVHVTKKHKRHAGSHRVPLVAFNGDQLPGFTVSEIPQGWHLSTSVSTALCITPDDGSVNDDPYDFEGKLCVLPQSVDELGLGPGDPVTVNGEPGHVDAVDGPVGSLQLRYITTDGHTVDVQSPTALNWTDAQIVAFAQGVQVTEHIGVTHG